MDKSDGNWNITRREVLLCDTAWEAKSVCYPNKGHIRTQELPTDLYNFILLLLRINFSSKVIENNFWKWACIGFCICVSFSKFCKLKMTGFKFRILFFVRECQTDRRHCGNPQLLMNTHKMLKSHASGQNKKTSWRYTHRIKTFSQLWSTCVKEIFGEKTADQCLQNSPISKVNILCCVRVNKTLIASEVEIVKSFSFNISSF